MSPTAPKSLCRNIRRSIAMGILCSMLPISTSAQTVPLPKDWCGRLWGIRTSANNAVLWDNPTTGTSTTAAPPNVAAIPAVPAGFVSSNNVTYGYATLGIHARSGTLYTLDRGNRTLYQYSMATGGTWTQTVLSQIPTIAFGAGVTGAQQAATNFNKMTVTRDQLIIASSDSLNVYTYDIVPATGALVSSTGTPATFTFDNLTPLPNGTTGSPVNPITNTTITGSNSLNGLNVDTIGGGDIAQDEYGDTYNVTYDNYPNIDNNTLSTVAPQYAYIYKKVGTQWVFKKRVQKATSTDLFAGLAFYNDTLYVKGTAGTLFRLPLTRSGSDYNWASTSAILTSVGNGTGTSDMASCGVPAISVTKTQQVYTDAAVTILSADQTKIVTGQYIKYTIVGTNTGDAWSRGSYINDPLPTGVTYVPNSATVNGTNINAATYPFDSNYIATSPGSAPGEIRLPFSPNTNTATFTFLAQVNGTVPTIQNLATIAYTNPYPSDPPNCATGLNCGTSPLATLSPSIFGNVWNDINGSAGGTFSNTIRDNGEVGTNTGTLNALFAILVDSNGKEIASSAVAADGSYKFLGLAPNQTGLNVQLSTTPGTVNLTTPVAPPPPAIPTGWKSTTPKTTSATTNPVTAFTLGAVDVLNKDFGIAQPANAILVKRITAINGQTTNPNDPTKNLTVVINSIATPNDDPARKWPSGYLKGLVDAGRVKPGDTIEYTVYYLNDGSADIKSLKICDPIRGLQTYVNGSMKLLPGGLADLPANRITLTDSATDTNIDRANTYASTAIPTDCNATSSTATGTNKSGVAIQLTGTGASIQPNLTALPGATTAGSPDTSFGWFRFTTTVDP